MKNIKYLQTNYFYLFQSDNWKKGKSYPPEICCCSMQRQQHSLTTEHALPFDTKVQSSLVFNAETTATWSVNIAELEQKHPEFLITSPHIRNKMHIAHVKIDLSVQECWMWPARLCITTHLDGRNLVELWDMILCYLQLKKYYNCFIEKKSKTLAIWVKKIQCFQMGKLIYLNNSVQN